MKTIVFLFILLLLSVFVNGALAESYRKTTPDFYMESYSAQMRRQTAQNVADTRAEEYRSRYESCDEHHFCTNATAQAKTETGTVSPFLYVPMMQ